jgi:hypothetical protein
LFLLLGCPFLLLFSVLLSGRMPSGVVGLLDEDVLDKVLVRWTVGLGIDFRSNCEVLKTVAFEDVEEKGGMISSASCRI